MSIDRVAGTLTIDIATFIPANMVTAPIGTTHFKIISAGAEIDFGTETYVVSNSETAILLLDATPSTAISQVNTVTANTAHPLFLVFGIEFYQEVNGQMYSLRNGAFNPLAIVTVDHTV